MKLKEKKRIMMIEAAGVEPAKNSTDAVPSYWVLLAEASLV